MILVDNSLFVFRIYIISILMFLIFICFILSKDIFRVFNKYIVFLGLRFNACDQYSYRLFDIYLDENKWLSCISFLEFLLKQKDLDTISIYSKLECCYQKIELLKISKYYANKI